MNATIGEANGRLCDACHRPSLNLHHGGPGQQSLCPRCAGESLPSVLQGADVRELDLNAGPEMLPELRRMARAGDRPSPLAAGWNRERPARPGKGR